MRIQFELGQESHKRHFTTIIDELLKRKHQVIMTACTKDSPGLVEHKVAPGDHRQLIAFQAHIRNDEWGELSYLIRTSRDYLRYLRPEHAQSTIIRERIKNMLDVGLQGIDRDAGGKFREILEGESGNIQALLGIERIFEGIEDFIPPHPLFVKHLQEVGADVLCVTPLVVTQYGQTELVKAARAIGVPCVFMVGSWDNLTTKGTVHVQPDFTVVWNEIQRQEASVFHNIPSEKVLVCGAARFDDFWERSIEVDREEYCQEFRFNPENPIITYLGSSNLISGDERHFVLRWINAIRKSSNDTLAKANVLIRPHPKFSKGWEEYFANMEGVAVNVSKVSTLKALNNDRDLFHCLIHARAVVGANTSAELEAAILGRPVFTIKDEELETGQEGTIHFGYLAGQLAKVASALHEHVLQLESELSTAENPNRHEEFLKEFLRPKGLTRRACEVTVDAIEGVVLKKNITEGHMVYPKTSFPLGRKNSWIARLMQHLKT